MNPTSSANDLFARTPQNTRRNRSASLWQAIFLSAIVIGILMLLVLLVTIVNQAFGLVIVEDKIPAATLSDRPLEALTREELTQILQANTSKNRYKTILRDHPVDSMPLDDLVYLVVDNVVQPQVKKSFPLLESLLNRGKIMELAKAEYPKGRVEFRSWLNPRFLNSTMSPRPENAGVRTAVMGSALLILITILVAFPLGVGAAIYLEEYADSRRWINRVIQTNIDNLAGVPSIIYGILGLAIFVRALEPLTSGAAFGVVGQNGRTILAAGLTMALLILPILIINAQEAIRAVPNSLRQASYGLGATKWQTIWFHVLPVALPGILTGTILAVSRAIGETAPLIIVGASTLIMKDPDGIFSSFTALPIQIYNWTTRPQDTFRNIAAAAILVLLALLLSLNAAAILLRNRFSRQ